MYSRQVSLTKWSSEHKYVSLSIPRRTRSGSWPRGLNYLDEPINRTHDTASVGGTAERISCARRTGSSTFSFLLPSGAYLHHLVLRYPPGRMSDEIRRSLGKEVKAVMVIL